MGSNNIFICLPPSGTLGPLCIQSPHKARHVGKKGGGGGVVAYPMACCVTVYSQVTKAVILAVEVRPTAPT